MVGAALLQGEVQVSLQAQRSRKVRYAFRGAQRNQQVRCRFRGRHSAFARSSTDFEANAVLSQGEVRML